MRCRNPESLWTGWPLLRGNLLHDFQALNGLEMSLFDYLDDLHQKPQARLTAADYAVLDQVAATILKPEKNFHAIRKLFEEMPRTNVIRSHLRMIGVLGDQPVRVTDRILDSDMQRLMLLGEIDEVEENSGKIGIDTGSVPWNAYTNRGSLNSTFLR